MSRGPDRALTLDTAAVTSWASRFSTWAAQKRSARMSCSCCELSLSLSLYIPIQSVLEHHTTAHTGRSNTPEKHWFRSSVTEVEGNNGNNYE